MNTKNYLKQKYRMYNLEYDEEIEKMIDTDKTIPIKDLIERLVEIDQYYYGLPWNICQIINNINMIIPVEDRE